MEILGFESEEILSVFHVIASVLKLSNLQFIPRANIDGTEGCSLMNEYGEHTLLLLLQCALDLTNTLGEIKSVR